MITSTEKIFEHFEKYIRLSPTLKSELSKALHFQSFEKGEMILNADTICTKSYFIQKGLVRSYFLKDGKEISEFFCGVNEWVNSQRSLMEQKIDIYYIDAIEPTETYFIHVEDLVRLFDNFPEMERYARLSMGTIFGHFLDRITSMRFTSAKERYVHFQETYAELHHRIPLGMVASYLGITQETLSRIRSEK